jgi:Cell wall-active antibiotics response LiaF, C-terminal
VSAGPTPPAGPEPTPPAGPEPTPPAGPEPTPPAAAEPGPPTDRHAPAAATVLVGTLLVLVGIAWLLDAAGVVVPWRAILPASLIAVGLACAAGAFRGRQHALMVVGVVLMVLLSLGAAADWDLDLPLTGVGDRSEQPTSPAQLRRYELGVGNFELDLRRLQLPPGTTTVEARVGIGELAVEVPEGVSLTVVARSGLGQVQVLGEEDGGIASRIDFGSEQSGDRRLEVDARVGLGEVRVNR